jgi:hypothetical protein
MWFLLPAYYIYLYFICMKRLVISGIAIFLLQTATAQLTKAQINDMERRSKEIKEMMRRSDSLSKRTDSILLARSRESLYGPEARRRDSMNVAMFVRLQKEREAKQRKQLWIRGGFFVAMLALFIAGIIVRRRRKQQAQA